MKVLLKAAAAIAVAGSLGIGVNRMIEDGGVFAVLNDEVPLLVCIRPVEALERLFEKVQLFFFGLVSENHSAKPLTRSGS